MAYLSRKHSEDFDLTDGQDLLIEAVYKNDLDDFELALDMDADLMLPNDVGVCVYELCLSTHGRAAFVQKCFENGCSPHYVNHDLNKAAINYAADSKDPSIIALILTHQHIMVNHTYCHLTPLISLAVNVSNDNVDDVIKCMEHLIFYGASTKIHDNSGMNPMQHLMHNAKLNSVNRKKIVESFVKFENDKANSICLEWHQAGGDALCALGTNENLRKNSARQVTALIPPTMLSYGIKPYDEPESGHPHSEDWHTLYLFFNAIKHKDNISFDELFTKELDCNRMVSNQTPLECALDAGNCYALKRLLSRPEVNIRSVECPLSRVIKKMTDDSGNYRKCFYMLLKNKNIEINETDITESTALHYAVETRNEEAINELLERGAFLGAKNNDKILSIDGISPDILKECFDNCITKDKVSRISMKFHNLRYQPRHAYDYQKEMRTLSYMAKSIDHRHLLEHPLVTCFLQYKWNQLSPIFYFNFILFVLFAASIMTHTVLKFSNTESTQIISAFRIMSGIFIGYMIIREFMQLVTLPRQYFQTISNYLEVTLIAFAIINCYGFDIDLAKKKIIAVITLLLIALELFLLCGCLPILSMSTHMLMLEEVCKSFLKSFSLYSIFLVTFSFCFYIIFGTVPDDPAEAKDGKDDKGDFNKFENPFKALVKTLAMLTGEFDAGDLEFTNFFSYFLFALFVFLMTIVMYNLLNGLAVSDIQTVMGQAKQNGTICRIDLLTRYEGVIVHHAWYRSFIKLYSSADPLGSFENEAFTKGAATNLNRETLELAMDILEQKRITSKRQQRLRNNDNRFNNIENKLAEIFKRLDFK